MGFPKAWLVGGAVRDFILGKSPTDIDIVCSAADPQEILAATGGTLVGKFPHCTVATVLMGRPVEIALLTSDRIEGDLGRRDFTANALASDSEGRIVDPFGGRSDIRRRILRLLPCSPLPYETDPVRTVRLLRLACTLNFEIEPGTEALTKRFASENRAALQNIPKERYGKEFLKAFASLPHDFLTLLDAYGLLPSVLPEIEKMRGVEQPVLFHPEGDVLTHTFRVVAEAQKTIQTRPEKSDIALALASLLHDVGKPLCARPHPKYGHTCFFGHDRVGEEIAGQMLASWAFPGKTAERIASLVRYHMLPGGDFTDRTAVKLVRKIGPETAELLFDLAFCDVRGAMGTGENVAAARALFHKVRDNLLRSREVSESSPRWLDGHDVMRVLQMPPGREIGLVLEEADVAIGTGAICTRDEALVWLKNRKGSKQVSGKEETGCGSVFY